MKSPFSDDPLEEVYLPRAPLVRVLAQVRFPKLLGLLTETGIVPFQDALRERYPVLRQDHTVGILITPDGVTSQDQKEPVWRFQSKAGDWQVSLSASFVALDTDAYVSRDNFCERFLQVLEVVNRLAEPALAERVGIRYFDRIDDPAQIARLASLVRPEILGGLAVGLTDNVIMSQSICESLFTFGDGQLLTRWGVLPPGAVLDPSLPPVTGPSWVLDLDVFQRGRFDFEPTVLDSKVRQFADRAYHFFRWAVTDDFLRDAGGEL